MYLNLGLFSDLWLMIFLTTLMLKSKGNDHWSYGQLIHISIYRSTHGIVSLFKYTSPSKKILYWYVNNTYFSQFLRSDQQWHLVLIYWSCKTFNTSFKNYFIYSFLKVWFLLSLICPFSLCSQRVILSVWRNWLIMKIIDW